MTAQEQAVAAMEREWPRWQIWVVHRVVGGTLWCAKRWDDETQLLHADSATELAEYLEAAAAGRGEADLGPGRAMPGGWGISGPGGRS